ncbi:exodeoxyribonuclease I [Candidatus Saccharibacteria bacterium]|nr:exodeoxyribonuclease I [Candidatus Saccharibacteria bacterium]
MTFYFYDLETGGLSPRASRIMQFAGQRTDMELRPVGEPDNILIKMTPDALPDPDAVLVTGITPQATLAGGITESEFVNYLTSKVFLPDTIFVGYNNVRFDDEFMRFTLWRNLADPYEWQWKNGCSRWDILDIARMTRALRPEGLKWPYGEDGTPNVKLEKLSELNNLTHSNAHDALSDVMAVIGVAKLIKQKQPKLYDYLLKNRYKKEVQKLVEKNEPIIYSSGRYPGNYEKTTVTIAVAYPSDGRGALMYDLRIIPDSFTDLSSAELAAMWSKTGKDAPYFPVKRLAYNRCPVIAPFSVLDSKSEKRLHIDNKLVAENLQKLRKADSFGDRLLDSLQIMDRKRQTEIELNEQLVDELLYDSFISGTDKTKMSVVRASDPQELANLNIKFNDQRLNLLLPIYKARNFPKYLNDDEKAWWEKFRIAKLLAGGDNSRSSAYFKRIRGLSNQPGLTDQDKYLLEELNLYGQSIMPGA